MIHTAKRFTIAVRQRYLPVMVLAAAIPVVACDSSFGHAVLLMVCDPLVRFTPSAL